MQYDVDKDGIGLPSWYEEMSKELIAFAQSVSSSPDFSKDQWPTEEHIDELLH